jgi:hypothetical protein
MILGPIIGNTFSTVNNSLSGLAGGGGYATFTEAYNAYCPSHLGQQASAFVSSSSPPRWVILAFGSPAPGGYHLQSSGTCT